MPYDPTITGLTANGTAHLLFRARGPLDAGQPPGFPRGA